MRHPETMHLLWHAPPVEDTPAPVLGEDRLRRGPDSVGAVSGDPPPGASQGCKGPALKAYRQVDDSTSSQKVRSVSKPKLMGSYRNGNRAASLSDELFT